MSSNESKQKRPEHFQLINAYDDIVRTAVKERMDTLDMCKCERCFLDACAIVFNQGYTHYVNTKEGELLKKVPHMHHRNQTDLLIAVINALRLVSDFPHHDDEESVIT